MSFATPAMTSTAVVSEALPNIVKPPTGFQLKQAAQNRDVIDFAGAVSIQAEEPVAVEPIVEIKAKITAKHESEDLQTTLLRQAREQIRNIRSSSGLTTRKQEMMLTQGDASHMNRQEILALKNEFQILTNKGEQPDFDSWVRCNSSRKEISMITGGNAMLHKQYVQLCEACRVSAVPTQTTCAPSMTNVSSSMKNMHDRISKLETQCNEHEDGLLHHTQIMQKVGTQVKEYTQAAQKTSSDIQTMRSELKKMDLNAQKHTRTLSNYNSQLQDLDVGMKHHKDVLQHVSDGLKQHKTIMSSRQKNAKLAQVSGKVCEDTHFQCYENMRRLLNED